MPTVDCSMGAVAAAAAVRERGAMPGDPQSSHKAGAIKLQLHKQLIIGS